MDATSEISPNIFEIINQTAATGDAWIRQRKQPLGTHKSSTKLLLLVMHGFDIPNNPYGLRNHQRTTTTSNAWI